MSASDPLPRDIENNSSEITVQTQRLSDLSRFGAAWDQFAAAQGDAGFYHRTAWGGILRQSLGHEPYFLCARRGERITGLLPLALVRSFLFGRFLVSLPYLNSAGVLSTCEKSAHRLIDRAVELAEELNVKHLELRQEREWIHPQLTEKLTSKVHLRLKLPRSPEELITGFKSKLRSQVKKSLSNGQSVAWGSEELLPEFYAVFSRNMRDLGTPVFPRSLFQSILQAFPNQAELCILRESSRPVAAALLVHGPSITQVPSASTLREFNGTNANMRLYWHLLERTIERGQLVFDFGRSSLDSGTYRFKEQWGALPEPAIWQYFRRSGEPNGMRPENAKFQRLITLWQRLPLGVANCLGPWIVKGIP